MFYKHIGQKLIKMCATFVDDTLRAGRKEDKEGRMSTKKRITNKLRKLESTNYTDLSISNRSDEYIVQQKEYISKPKPLDIVRNFSKFETLCRTLPGLRIYELISPGMLPF